MISFQNVVAQFQIIATFAVLNLVQSLKKMLKKIQEENAQTVHVFPEL